MTKGRGVRRAVAPEKRYGEPRSTCEAVRHPFWPQETQGRSAAWGASPPQDDPAHRGRWRQVWTWWRGRGEPATPLRCLPVGARRPRSVPHGRHAGPEAPSQDTRSQDAETRGRQDVSPAVRGGVFRTREEAGNTQASSNCRMKEQNAA